MQESFVAKLEPQAEGGYTISVPGLPGCISEGETKEEAIHNIREAFLCYAQAMDDSGVPLPALDRSRKTRKFEVLVDVYA